MAAWPAWAASISEPTPTLQPSQPAAGKAAAVSKLLDSQPTINITDADHSTSSCSTCSSDAVLAHLEVHPAADIGCTAKTMECVLERTSAGLRAAHKAMSCTSASVAGAAAAQDLWPHQEGAAASYMRAAPLAKVG